MFTQTFYAFLEYCQFYRIQTMTEQTLVSINLPSMQIILANWLVGQFLLYKEVKTHWVISVSVPAQVIPSNKGYGILGLAMPLTSAASKNPSCLQTTLASARVMSELQTPAVSSAPSTIHATSRNPSFGSVPPTRRMVGATTSMECKKRCWWCRNTFEKKRKTTKRNFRLEWWWHFCDGVDLNGADNCDREWYLTSLRGRSYFYETEIKLSLKLIQHTFLMYALEFVNYDWTFEVSVM